VSHLAADVETYEGHFHALMARLDQLEERLEFHVSKALNEVNNGNKPKDLPLDKLFPTLCMFVA